MMLERMPLSNCACHVVLVVVVLPLPRVVAKHFTEYWLMSPTISLHSMTPAVFCGTMPAKLKSSACSMGWNPKLPVLSNCVVSVELPWARPVAVL